MKDWSEMSNKEKEVLVTYGEDYFLEELKEINEPFSLLDKI